MRSIDISLKLLIVGYDMIVNEVLSKVIYYEIHKKFT